MDLFETGFSEGFDATGEGFNGEYARPRQPWPVVWASIVAEGRANAWAAMLSANLAAVAALCRAHQLGRYECWANSWRPGCGRSAQ